MRKRKEAEVSPGLPSPVVASPASQAPSAGVGVGPKAAFSLLQAGLPKDRTGLFVPPGLRRMKKAMKWERSAGLELEEHLIRPEKTNGILQPEDVPEQPGPGPSLGVKEGLSNRMQEHWEAQWQGFLTTLQPIHTAEEHSVMQDMAPPWDNTRTFLASFEQVAQACQWPRGEWVARLMPALSGAVEEAFQGLDVTHQGDYGKVKAAILRAEALRVEKERQHFRHFSCPEEVGDPRRLHVQLQELCHRWLRPERHSKEQILELLILEQFLASLPSELQGWIRAGGPGTCSQAVALAEDFLRNQQTSVKERWKGPLKEEGADFLGEEEGSLNTAEQVIYEEDKQICDGGVTALGGAIKGPHCRNSSLPPENQDVLNSGVKTEPVDLKEARHSLQIAKQNLTQPSQQPAIWHVQEEDGGSVHSLGDVKGREVKTGNSQQEGIEPKDGTTGQGPVPEVAHRFEEGFEPMRELEEQPTKNENKRKDLPEDLIAVIHQPLEVHTLSESSTLSTKDRSYRHPKLAFDVLPDWQGREECSGMSEEPFWKNLYSEKHQRTVKEKGKPTLAADGKGSISNRLLSNHKERTPHNTSSFKCTTLLKKNQGIEGEEGLYECPHCGKCFRDREDLDHHQDLHTEEKRREDPVSGDMLSFRETLARSQETPTLVESYVCCQCGKSFSQRRTLENHQTTHTGVAPYVCSQCGKCFNQRRYLKIHQRIHTGEKPYKCSECGKRFVRGQCLKNHQRTHIGDKPYACSQCGKCFNQRRYLKNHLRTHTGWKPYKCSQCGRSFGQSGALLNHQKSHMEKNPMDVLSVEGGLN